MLASIFLILFSGLVYGWFTWYDRNNDALRYYLNHDKVKYNLLLFSKCFIVSVLMYNTKDLVMTKLFKSIPRR